MPASPASLALTDAYRERLLGVRLRTVALTVEAWRLLEPDDLDTSYARWQNATVAQTENAKRTAVAATAGYFGAYVAAELGTSVPAPGVDPDAYLETVDGRTLTRALLPPLFTVKALIGAGRTSTEALRAGEARATRIVAGETLDTPRRALSDLMEADDRITGYRRTTSRNPCGACLALADGFVLPAGERLRVHGHCRCTAEPTLRGVRERTLRPTGQERFDAMSPGEQAALFRGRGGAEKAALIASGDVPLQALIQHERRAATPDEVTETPLAALRTPTA